MQETGTNPYPSGRRETVPDHEEMVRVKIKGEVNVGDLYWEGKELRTDVTEEQCTIGLTNTVGVRQIKSSQVQKRSGRDYVVVVYNQTLHNR